MGKQGTNKRRDEVKASPFAGCSLVLAAMLAMLFLVGYVIWALFRLDSELAKFTGDKPVPAPVLSLVENARGLNVLKAKLNDFDAAFQGGKEATLRLQAEEINLAIAAYEPFKELRGTFAVQSIADNKLHIQIAFPMNGKPMSGEFRYLNGTMIAVPRLTEQEIVLDVEDVLVPGATVPEGFLGQLTPYRITESYTEDPFFGPWMGQLTTVSLQEDALALTFTPGERTPVSQGNLRSAILRALALFALLVVLLVLTLAVFVILRKKRQEALSASTDSQED